MKGRLSVFLLLALATSSTYQNSPSPLILSNSFNDKAPANLPKSNADIICFPPPDDHHVSEVIGTCNKLFAKFIKDFGVMAGQPLYWSGNNSRWHDPGVVHLPMVEVLLNSNQTQACLMEITDSARVGDSYTAQSVAEAGKKVLDVCFKKDFCGEIALLPTGTTTLAVCGSVHRNASGPIPVEPGPRIIGGLKGVASH
ncbi:MAG: hypothetical protein Q9217_001568 [Psora testacea]